MPGMEEARERQAEAGLGPDPGDVREVLAIRPGGMRSVVDAIPALRHLRTTYTGARVTVAAGPAARELLDACPYVDRIVDLEPPRELLVERFDVAVSFASPDDAASTPVGDVHASFRASWRSPGDGPRGAIHPEWPVRLAERQRMLRLAWLLGGEGGVDPEPGLWPTLADRNGAARLVAGISRPVALVHAGAGDPARRWPAASWARVVDLVDGAGLAPVLVGTSVDRAVTDEVVIAARCAPSVVVERTSVGELAGLLERTMLFVGGDSGPAALAGVLGVRSVIVGPGSTIEHTARPGMVDLVTAGPCACCGDAGCTAGSSAAAAVPLEPVLATVGLAAATAMRRWRAQQIA